jgi:GntR family transcriptional regulator, transcriptional repressor for pyruvate dehydrogenase complex
MYVCAVEPPFFAPVRERRTFEAIVAQIAEAVRVGELRTGDRLPSERVLAAQMEVSRPTLREALRVLADSGVVEVAPGAGGGSFVVSNSVPTELVARMDVRLAEVPAVLEARRAFEPQVALLAARAGSAADFALLERIVEQQETALDDWARITQLDTKFHLEVARATGNSLVVSVMTQLSRHLTIARATRMDARVPVETAVAANRTLAEVLRARDEEAVMRAMDEHLRLLEDAWFAAT